MSVPERDYTESVEGLARRIAGLGLLGLGLVTAGGVIAARRLARPLRRLAVHAGRIGRGRGDGTGRPEVRDEIGTLARSLHVAAQTARAHALVSDRLGRYVSPELADRWLRERRGPRLGAESRDVAILMSDLRGFSSLSEQLGDYFGAKEGVLVTSVADNSTAAKAGLKAGDVIVSIDGSAVDSPSALSRQVRRLEEGHEFTLEIVREKNRQTLKGKVEARQSRRWTTRTVI